MKRLGFLTLHEWGLLAATAAIFLMCAFTVEGFLFYDGEFDAWNLSDRCRHWVEIGLIAIPMTFIICTGGIDLSVGSMLALSGMALGIAWRDWGWDVWTASAFAVGVGTAAGAVNGVLGSTLAVAPLVATLATRALYRGAALGFSEGDPVRGFPDSFLGISEWAPGGVPGVFILLAGSVLAGHLFFRKGRIGRWTAAVGENETAAEFAGIPTKRVKFALYTFSGLMCGLAAPIHVSRFATANPEHAGSLELDVIAAVVVGGTRITGGSGSVLGTGLGLLVVGMFRFALDLKGFPQQTQTILMGLIVVGMAVLNEWMGRRGGR